MGVITLQNRQSLSRRIHAFGGVNGRGSNRSDSHRRVRFGSRSPESIAAAWALLATPYHQAQYAAEFSAWVQNHPGEKMLDPEAWYLERHPEMFETASVPVVTPVVPATTPGTTDAEYQAALVQAQIEAARLQAVATAKQAENAADSKRIAAEDELARRNAEIAKQTEVNPDVTPKPNAFPWLIAAGVAFLVLKG